MYYQNIKTSPYKVEPAKDLRHNMTLSQKEYDRYMYEFLMSIGIHTLRIKDENVLNDIQIVKEMIRIRLTEL